MGITSSCSLFLDNDTSTSNIYTLSLHDALPISKKPIDRESADQNGKPGDKVSVLTVVSLSRRASSESRLRTDRKSTRLNSSHITISYAVFCLKKKNILHDNRNPCIHSAPPSPSI